VRPHARGCGAGARWGRGSAVVRPVGALSARTGAIAAGGPLRVDMLAAGAAGGRDHGSGMGSHGRTGVREAQAGGRLGRYASGGEPSSKCPSKRLSECPFRHRWRNGPVAGAHGWFADRHVVHFRLVVLSFGCSALLASRRASVREPPPSSLLQPIFRFFAFDLLEGALEGEAFRYTIFRIIDT
jgi:hypothetical protein